MNKPVISLRNVDVVYRREGRTPIAALSGIDLKLFPGEKVAVFGPNGSGKSTLLRILAGLERPATGEVEILDHNMGASDLPAVVRRRIGFVFQNPEDVFAAETVAEEIRFVLECQEPKVPVSDIGLRTLLAEAELAHLANRPLNRLSGGEKQKVALASVLAVRPEVIFFDEPTSYLDPPARREFLQHSVFVGEDYTGTTILVTQYWSETAYCDRLLMLEGGRIVYDGPPTEYTPPEAPPASRRAQLDEKWLAAVAAARTDPLIEVKDLCQTAPIFVGELSHPLSNLTFSVRPGERVGIVGPTGAGKSTLAYHLAGLMPKFAGGITIAGRALAAGDRKNDRPPVALLFQNPDHHQFAETVAQDVAFGPQNLNFPQAEIPAHATRSLQLAGLTPGEFGPRSPFEISGGEQRKAALAGTLALPAAVYIFDEPSAYLDSESAAHVESLIIALAKAGKSVLVISHDLPFLRRVCPRWLILDEGKFIYDGNLSELDTNPGPLKEIGFDHES